MRSFVRPIHIREPIRVSSAKPAPAFIEAPKTPGEPSKQAVDGSAAVSDMTDDGPLAGVRRELSILPGRIRVTQSGSDLRPVGDCLDPRPRSRRRREPAGCDLACPLDVAAMREAQRGGGSGEVGNGRMVRMGQTLRYLLGVIGERAGEKHLAAFQDEPVWFQPGGTQVQQGLVAKLNEFSATLDVPGDEIAAQPGQQDRLHLWGESWAALEHLVEAKEPRSITSR